MKILILKGPIRSGKTTWLKEMYNNKKNVAGILSPVINEKRYFLNLENNETQPMEADEKEQEVLSVGRYRFSLKSFTWARQVILNGLENGKELLIIDEIGPLELQGKGFAETLKTVLPSKSDFQLLLVIRENCVDEVLNYFGINKMAVEFISKNKS